MASHTALAKQLGASEELLDAMYNIDQHADMFTSAERAALTLAERMTTDPHGVDEEVWAELRALYDGGQVVELAAVIGLFNYFNRFNDALHVEIMPSGSHPPSPPQSIKGEGDMTQ
jgi:alkylhydroperoxidase family enzyme